MVPNNEQDLLKVSRNGSVSGITQNLRAAILLGHLYRDPPVLETMMMKTLSKVLTLLDEILKESVELAQHLGVDHPPVQICP